MRSKFHIEGEDKKSIVFTEIPYQVNKARVIEKIAELVKDKKIEGSLSFVTSRIKRVCA